MEAGDHMAKANPPAINRRYIVSSCTGTLWSTGIAPSAKARHGQDRALPGNLRSRITLVANGALSFDPRGLGRSSSTCGTILFVDRVLFVPILEARASIAEGRVFSKNIRWYYRSNSKYELLLGSLRKVRSFMVVLQRADEGTSCSWERASGLGIFWYDSFCPAPIEGLPFGSDASRFIRERRSAELEFYGKPSPLEALRRDPGAATGAREAVVVVKNFPGSLVHVRRIPKTLKTPARA
ncbi:hypothetical protein KM043_008537 [Ampulex compressa]|nr:hypothetical protein KM043_008537 [Ampulex compressa]